MIIVHILTRLLRAGSEENTLATCRSQAAAGHRVVVMHGREFDQSVRSEADNTRAVVEMSRRLKGLGADVVHTHQSKAGVLGRLAARLARTPCVIHGVHILPF